MAKKKKKAAAKKVSKKAAADAPIDTKPVAEFRPRITRGKNGNKAEVEKLHKIAGRISKRAAADISTSGNFSFYSPQLSTDYLELPRSLQEKREFFRHFYHSDEIVGRAIDLHTELPLSKVRLTLPKGTNDHKKAEKVLAFFQQMVDRNKLFQILLSAAHEYWLQGNCFIFAEDGEGLETNFDPNSLEIDDFLQDEDTLKEKRERANKAFGQANPHYRGWERLTILPPDNIMIRSYSFTDIKSIELVPSGNEKAIYSRALQGDPGAEQIVNQFPDEVINALNSGSNIFLDSDPYSGSFCYHLARRRSWYEDLGSSILERCLRTLVYRDKLRQAQSLITDRHMTPIHLVWAENLSEDDVENLREQVDMSLLDPDYSIVTNFEVHWTDIGAQERILELSTEYEHNENLLFAGLGVTRELLTGEGTYGGNRITLEIMNTQYLLFREILQEYVEQYLFKPVALKKHFIEIDAYGNEILLYPKLSFTRLAIYGNTEYFEQIFSLYQKGSVSIDYVLELLNIDAEDSNEKVKRDLFTIADSKFNQVIDGIYTTVATRLADETNVGGKLMKYLNLKPAPAGGIEEGAEGTEEAEAGAGAVEEMIEESRF